LLKKQSWRKAAFESIWRREKVINSSQTRLREIQLTNEHSLLGKGKTSGPKNEMKKEFKGG